MDTRKKDDTVGEEVSAFGQRVTGAAKNAAGDIADDRGLERKGERENAQGRARQASNNVMDETDGVRAATIDASSSDTGDRYVTGLYQSPEAAGRAYEGLTKQHGYRSDDINVLMSNETRRRHFGDVSSGTALSGGSKAAEGFGKGGAIGGGIGAALGAIFAVGTSVVVPGLGLVVAGPIAAALAGAGAGGAAGGVLGLLIGAGIPEDRAREYERGINDGGIVLGTRARDERHAADLERDFKTYGSTNVMR